MLDEIAAFGILRTSKEKRSGQYGLYNEEGGMGGGDLKCPFDLKDQLKGGAGNYSGVDACIAAVQRVTCIVLDGDDNEDSSEYLRELDEPTSLLKT